MDKPHLFLPPLPLWDWLPLISPEITARPCTCDLFYTAAALLQITSSPIPLVNWADNDIVMLITPATATELLELLQQE